MNQWVGHTLIATAEAKPLPLTQSSFLFPSFPKVLLPPITQAPSPCRNLPGNPMAITTHVQEGKPTRARPSHMLVALHGMGEARGVLCCVFQRIPLPSSLLYQGKQLLPVLGPRANPKIAPWSRKKEYSPFK